MIVMRAAAVGLALALAASGQDRAQTATFELAHGIILVQGSINGKGGYTFVFDCGANQTIVTPDAAKDLGIRGTPAQDQSGIRLEVARLESLSVGDATAKGVDVLLWDPPQAQALKQMGKTYHGIVGYSFLSKFIVTIDYRASKIRLASPDTPTQGAAPVLGLRIEETRAAEVEKGSVAEKAGFKSGDIVLKLNGLTVANAADVAAVVAVAKAGDLLTFSVRRDKKELTLKIARP